MEWTAEITNDPDKDYELYVELLEDDHSMARIQRDADGKLELRVYSGPVSIPGEWLIDLLQRAQKDLTVG